MTELISLLAFLRCAGYFCAMIYLQEAHADDVWPLGYGIQSHKELADRLGACEGFLKRYPALRQVLDAAVVDDMDNSFLHAYGAWPERYYLVSEEGQVEWESAFNDGDGHSTFEEVRLRVPSLSCHRVPP